MKKAVLGVFVMGLFLLQGAAFAGDKGCGEPVPPAPGQEVKTARPAAPGTAPIAVAKDPVYNGGRIKQGIPLAHTFTIKNEGTADLEITKAKGG